MQPDPFTFLQSARREMRLAAQQLQADIRGVYLTRAAQVLERLAFYETGLEAILSPAIECQVRILAELQNLSGRNDPDVPREPIRGKVEEFDELNLALDRYLRALASDPRMADADFARRVDDAFDAVSHLTFEVTKGIADGARKSAETWEAARPTFRPGPISEDILTAYLRDRFPGFPGVQVRDLQKLDGLNANEAFFFKVEGIPDWPERVILRRAVPVRIQPTPITEEFDVLQAVYGHVPVPRPLLAESNKRVIGQPFIVLERLNGEIKPLPDMGADGRKGFLKLAAMMARLHHLDPEMLPSFRRTTNVDALAWLRSRIDVYEGQWLRGAREPVHTVTAAFHWLKRHAGSFVRLQAIVHGDLDHRNVLFDEDLDIVALIDWEVSHQGHPAEDLAYVRESVEKVMPWSEFIAAYESAGGSAMTDQEMRYAKVLSNLLRVTTSMIAHSAYVDGDLDNFLMGSVRTIETEMACQYLHEAIYGD